jgi:hypothetical protein
LPHLRQNLMLHRSCRQEGFLWIYLRDSDRIQRRNSQQQLKFCPSLHLLQILRFLPEVILQPHMLHYRHLLQNKLRLRLSYQLSCTFAILAIERARYVHTYSRPFLNVSYSSFPLRYLHYQLPRFKYNNHIANTCIAVYRYPLKSCLLFPSGLCLKVPWRYLHL